MIDRISPLSTPSSSPVPSSTNNNNSPVPPVDKTSGSSDESTNKVTGIISALNEAALASDLSTLLTLLRDHRSSLSCIPLPPPKPCTRAQAVKDLLRERVVLNGVRFLGQGSLFLETLSRLAKTLCSSPSVGGSAGDSNGHFVTEAILTRCARTTSGADSYYTVDKIIGAQNLLLKPRGGQLPPIDIELYSTANSVCCAITSTNCYGFYKFDDIEKMGNTRESINSEGSLDGGGMFGRPWLSVDTVVVEKIDFRTGRSLRFLRVEIPEERERRETMGSDSPSATPKRGKFFMSP